ncbi:PREDICTED: cell division cycle-associated protein 7-like [Priapulus caudatus]|uniref:Cell division cycle-associated protein 7-like n=1 Tax=Priapulus caudatus TaxID=37621 RepID=A0ABM1ESQ1_PRICU|nr:PREDICTED: cell division cycle-associated protein 7-like [Priapulus caudatus]
MLPNMLPEKCEYEELRRKNIAERKEMLTSIVSEIKEVHKDVIANAVVKTQQAKRRRVQTRVRIPREYMPYRTRGQTKKDNITPEMECSQVLKIRFPFKHRSFTEILEEEEQHYYSERWEEEEEDEEEDEEEVKRKPRRATGGGRAAGERVIVPVEEITSEDLKLVSDHVSEKTYDAINGTTCHQCRQKTRDVKTICRGPDCSGVRGQFCGPCLRNRYGEDARQVLMDPEWLCPVCRDICNCSICRRRSGRTCTGQLYTFVRENGYEDVHTYLKR